MTKVSGNSPANSGATVETEAMENLNPEASEMAGSFEAMLDANQGSLGNLDPSANMKLMMNLDTPASHGLPQPAQHLSVKHRLEVERHMNEAKEHMNEAKEMAEVKQDDVALALQGTAQHTATDAVSDSDEGTLPETGEVYLD